MKVMLEYSYIDSLIHKLTGASKLIFLLGFITASMISYDTRFLAFMFILSIFIFKISKVSFKEIAFIFYFIMIFLIINSIIVFLISPFEGVSVYGTKTELFKINSYYIVTAEQLFYQFNFMLKYLIVTPIALVFMISTNPSEFASSLNKIGINYKIAYSVAIALRYIPDIQREYHEIAFAQQGRGIDMSKNVSVIKRVKNSAAIIMPLIFSSLEKIETISSAMEIRAFGNNKKRTWYSAKKLKKMDYGVIIIAIILLGISILLFNVNQGRFFNPFI